VDLSGASGVRVLVLADTHIGIDTPLRPRVERRRRGDDFLASFARALAPALGGEVDVVVHAGDLLDRPRLPPAIVERALEPLLAVARAGVPVLLVPGNHERSRIPQPLHARHERLSIFHDPGTIVLPVRGVRLAFGAFAYVRAGIRAEFRAVLARTGLGATPADVRVLCMHHCVEGATCGPGQHVFRSAPDVVRAADLPREVAIVLTGHVHRHQFLERDLAGAPLPAPVLYPGSVERTSFAEKDEPKGFAIVELAPDGTGRGRLLGREQRPLPARPMIEHPLLVAGRSRGAVEEHVRRVIAATPADAILRLHLVGQLDSGAASALSAAALRANAPPTMSVSVALPRHSQDAADPQART
jgi:DNA repair exonuclease SbcCD nuclease subunit